MVLEEIGQAGMYAVGISILEVGIRSLGPGSRLIDEIRRGRNYIIGPLVGVASLIPDAPNTEGFQMIKEYAGVATATGVAGGTLGTIIHTLATPRGLLEQQPLRAIVFGGMVSTVATVAYAISQQF
jgi:hypothetical protein